MRNERAETVIISVFSSETAKSVLALASNFSAVDDDSVCFMCSSNTDDIDHERIAIMDGEGKRASSFSLNG